MAKKVYIAVGHGGDDPGAVANGFREKNLNLVTAIACKDELLRRGVEVNIDRTTDIELTMTQTVNACNAYAPDLAVDIHHNAGGGDGVEVFHTIHGGTGKTLAVNIIDEVVKIGQNSRGAKTRKSSDGSDYYGFIRRTTPPAVIVECAFLDNKTDVQIVDTKTEQKAMGVAIAKGILKTLGITDKAESAPETDVLYCVQVGAFAVKANGEKLLAKLKAAGYNDAFITTKPHK